MGVGGGSGRPFSDLREALSMLLSVARARLERSFGPVESINFMPRGFLHGGLCYAASSELISPTNF